MSFKAELIIGGKSANVLECNYGFSQHTDASGKPSTMPRGGTISLILESARDTDLVQWMISPEEKRDGSIVFKRRDHDSSLRTVEFSGGICIQFHESYHHSGSSPMVTHIVISARELKIGSVAYQRKWE
ncbi:type VI secretion system tube protein TssD [Chitinophaga solisilvae]|uniref:Phage tail protein n=1 Tax=Chitinophaga solisilvae TaxID=1233460 RepID=A0A433WF60_9BACT|nr:type VI secretion system tube protein TssD [Chitinophaga solisilvae]NSL87950.1 phage tail protein [Chitinophaga solisilvae]